MTHIPMAALVDASVIIATYNRASLLRSTLHSLGRCRFAGQWEIIVVDNDSTDDTRAQVESLTAAFPTRLVYVFERTPGRSAALNAGISASQGQTILTTDDDVQVDPDWVNAALAGLDRHRCDYVTGRVRPNWEDSPPAWLPKESGVMWGVVALLDFGPDPLPLKGRAPIGVNAGFRRSAFERIGVFSPLVGRKRGTLLGQEVREWHLRARSAGLVGFYVPDMVVDHLIPKDRLTKRYFRSWFYWHGVSRAILYREHAVDMESPEHTVIEFERIPHIGGTPRYLYRGCLNAIVSAFRARLRGDPVASFRDELKIWRFLGIVRQRWQDRRQPIRASPMSSTLRMRNTENAESGAADKR